VRFGILIAIIVSIILFKYFTGRHMTSAPVPPYASSSMR
jgi:hypothetical protein